MSQEEFEEAAQAIAEVTDEDIQSVSNIAQEMVSVHKEIEELTAALKEKSEVYRKISEEVLPEAMIELGLTQLRMVDGSMIEVNEEVYASISKDKRSNAHAWLREHGHASLIKHDYKISFGRDEDHLASLFKELLDKNEYKYQDSETVHWQTLRAFCREQINKGTDIPTDLFGVHLVNKATIK